MRGLAIYGGLNEMLAQRMARIETVGLQPAKRWYGNHMSCLLLQLLFLVVKGKLAVELNLQIRHMMTTICC